MLQGYIILYLHLQAYMVLVGSHSSHVPYARDLCEAYRLPTLHPKRIRHPSINNAYVSQRSDTRAR